MIKENLHEVCNNIKNACERVGRPNTEVTLIAVSKTKPIEMIDEVIKEGIFDFGENKVQELTMKYDVLPKHLNWHLIGHLQRNKVKNIVDKVKLIHSVDSIRLAEQINEEAKKVNLIVNILVQVNVAEEESKYGFSCDEIESTLKTISQLPNVKVKGLMTIAPFVENPEDNRIHFRNLHKLYVDIKSKNIDNIDMDILSMGMTGDYEVAIEEGATMVRVGTGIFGERNYYR